MKPIITILTGDRAGEKITLEPLRTYFLGRDPSSDIPVPETKVSRRHAHIVWNSKASIITLEDLKSLNGTIVNGTPIDGAIQLQNRDRFQIGSILFELTLSETDTVDFPEIEIIPTNGEEPLPLIEVADEFPEPEEDDHRYRTDGTSIAGNLRELPLPDLLQMLASSRRSGKLVIAPQRKDLTSTARADCAILWLKNGELIGAEVNNISGEDAVFEVLGWKAGYFALYYKEPITNDRNLHLPLEALLIEGLRKLDEEKTMTVQFKPTDFLDVNPDAPLNLLEADQLRIFQIVWKKKKVSAIWENSHLEKEKTSTILRILLRQDYIKRVKG